MGRGRTPALSGARRGGSAWRAEGAVRPVSFRFVDDVLTVALTARVFGRDAAALLRRAAAAGVRMGVGELRRAERRERER